MRKKVSGCKRFLGVVLFVSLVVLQFSTICAYADVSSVIPPAVSADWAINGICFPSADEGWAVGFDNINKTGVSLHYANGTWTNVTLPAVSSQHWSLYAVSFPSAAEGWAVGKDTTNEKGLLFHYTGGAWTNITLPDVRGGGKWSLNSVSFPSTTEGWAVGVHPFPGGAGGVLLHYTNGTWSNVWPPMGVASFWNLNGISFSSSTEGWAVGEDFTNDPDNDKGVLLHYVYGDWTNIAPPVVSASPGAYWSLNSVSFPSTNEGWAVGEDDTNYLTSKTGVLLHFTNGTWTNATLPSVSPVWWLNGVNFPSAAEGWAVGAKGDSVDKNANLQGVLLHYSNGVWNNVTLPHVSSNWDLTRGGVSFPSPTEGWAAGYDIANKRGVLLHISSTNNCAASLSNDFKVHVPIGVYSGQSYSADFKWDGGDSVILTNLTPLNDTSPFSNCAPSTVSSALLLHIPVIMYNGISYWADVQCNTDESPFKIVRVGQN